MPTTDDGSALTKKVAVAVYFLLPFLIVIRSETLPDFRGKPVSVWCFESHLRPEGRPSIFEILYPFCAAMP